MLLTVPIAIACAGILMLLVGAINDDRQARIARTRPVKLELPLLHSINDDRCIGCEACVDVCPTNVLELVDHKVRVARFTDCVQCEQCAHSCPTTALVMFRQGDTPQMLTVPRLDDKFQTGVPGQYLIGEVAGKPLVKNAANLGRAVIEHIARELPRPASRDVLDVVIVGSGPGGLSAGLTCIKHKLSCVVLEKEHVLASTVARYPKGKHFMAEPSHVQNVSFLPVFDGSKEQLVAAWRRVVDGVKLPVKLGEAVETVQRGDDGIFTVKTTVATYRARTVVLATGLRGKPRLLAVPGANLEKVQSRLDDAAAFAHQDVLVVGGGDSAVEAALSLAEAGARVTLSYRGDGFKRCKPANQKRLAERAQEEGLTILLESNVTRFDDATVSIETRDGLVTTCDNQAAFVLIGADTPVAWLEANHVEFIEREHLYALGSTEDSVRNATSDVRECPRSAEEALAVLLGHRPTKTRLRSVVEGLLTEVTGVFRLPTHAGRASTAGRAPTADVAPKLAAPARRQITLSPIEETRPSTRYAIGHADTDWGGHEVADQTEVDIPSFATPVARARRMAAGSTPPPPLPANPTPRRATLGPRAPAPDRVPAPAPLAPRPPSPGRVSAPPRLRTAVGRAAPPPVPRAAQKRVD